MTKPSTKPVPEYTYENITRALGVAGWTNSPQPDGTILWYPNPTMEYADTGIIYDEKAINGNPWEFYQFYRKCITLGNEATQNVLARMATPYKLGSYEACIVHPNSNPQHYVMELTPRRTPYLRHYDEQGNRTRDEYADKRIFVNTLNVEPIIKYLITNTGSTDILQLAQLDGSVLTVQQKKPLHFWFIAVKNGECTLYTHYQFMSKADIFLSAHQISRTAFDINKQYGQHARDEWQGQVIDTPENVA